MTPSLQGEVDFLYRFSDLVKESLFDAATCFSVLLAALVLVLPSRVWHYPICFQLDSMLSAAFVAFPGFWFPGCENIFENKPKAGLGCGFSKGKGSSKFLREVDDKIGTFPPSQVRDAGIQAVASVAAISCAAALASAFAYLFALDVGISAAAAIVYECTLVLECAILSSVFFAFRFNISAAAAFSDAVTLVSGSACLWVAVFCIALATAVAWLASFRFLCLVRDLVLSGTSVACQL